MSLSLDAGASWTDAGATAAPAIMGVSRSVLAPAGSILLDMAGSVEVELAHDGMWLQSCSDAALGAGANLAMLGPELIQFGDAEHVSERRFRLGRLLRGRRGTEWASGGHVVGEAFALLERNALAPIEVPRAAIGTVARLRAFGRGDGEEGVEAEAIVDAAALRPPSPVHLRAERTEAGDLAIRWVRRSRAGWDWLDGSDAPVAEESEAYQLVLRGGQGEQRFALTEPGFLLSAAAMAADWPGGPIEVEVRQAGGAGLSQPAWIIFDQA